MTGILKFKLPDEEEEFKYAQNGILYSIALDEVTEYVRQKAKYGEDEKLAEAMDELLQFIYNAKSERNLN